MQQKYKEFLLGLSLAITGCKMYEALSNQSCYINNYRIHHYQIGLSLLLIAKLKEDPFWLGLGCGLVLDDRKDLLKDLKKLLN